MNMYWVDIAVVGVILVSTLIAVLRGFVREVLSILAWAAALTMAIWLGPSASAFLHQHISTPFVAPILAYATIFLLVLIPLAFASHLIALRVRRSPVGTIDRVLGVPFGILRGLAVIGLAYFTLSLAIPPDAQPAWLTHARLLPVIRASSNAISAFLPDIEHSQFIKNESLAADIHSVAHAYRHQQKIYRATDRRALDQLIANTSISGTGRR
ncbi:MAG TPA: CvpA family protein [Rhizomicrobium sp.]